MIRAGQEKRDRPQGLADAVLCNAMTEDAFSSLRPSNYRAVLSLLCQVVILEMINRLIRANRMASPS